MDTPADRKPDSGPWLTEQQFRLLVDGLSDYSLYMLSPNGTVSSWNSGAERIKGYSAQEIVGLHFSHFFTPEDRLSGMPEQALAVAAKTGRFEAEGERMRKDGTRFWAHVIIDTILDDDGYLVGFAKITRDITRQKADADRIREVSHNLELSLANMSQGLCLFDVDGKLVLRNARVGEIFEVDPARITPGMSLHGVLEIMLTAHRPAAPDEVDAVVRRHLDLIAAADGHAVHEALVPTRTLSITHRTLAEGGWLTTFEDITERCRAEARIEYLARHDGLTGLPNRMCFGEHLARELELATTLQQQVGVVGIDLDRFKEINDVHGHAMGDAVLIAHADRMRALLRDGEFVGRTGGDEFAGIVRYADPAHLRDFVTRLEEALFTPMVLHGFQVNVGASLGVAVFPADADSAQQLVNNADLAMYRAKGDFGQHICYYEAQMDDAVRARRSTATELWLALERHEFVIAYQVQQTIASGELIGYEALVRWNHPRRGLVAPGEFIPVAEDCGAIIPLGLWVLRHACKAAAQWPLACKVAVNLSAVQLAQAEFPQIVEAVLKETGLKPERLELEITESVVIADKAKALETLRQIKALGVTIALDDFGTGYSSLDTLRSFPFDKIKLDQTFMTEVAEDEQARAIIRAILALGHSLSVPVLAEGVETEAQLDVLRAEGCDEVQGFLLGRPEIRSHTEAPTAMG